MILCDFYLKSFEILISAAILNLLTRKSFGLRPKLYLVCQNLALCQI